MIFIAIPPSSLASNLAFSPFLHFVSLEEERKKAIMQAQREKSANVSVYPTMKATGPAGGLSDFLRTPYREITKDKTTATPHLKVVMESPLPVTTSHRVREKTNKMLRDKLV